MTQNERWEELKFWLEKEKRRVYNNDFTTVRFHVDGSFSVSWRPICEAIIGKMAELERK